MQYPLNTWVYCAFKRVWMHPFCLQTFRMYYMYMHFMQGKISFTRRVSKNLTGMVCSSTISPPFTLWQNLLHSESQHNGEQKSGQVMASFQDIADVTAHAHEPRP